MMAPRSSSFFLRRRSRATCTSTIQSALSSSSWRAATTRCSSPKTTFRRPNYSFFMDILLDTVRDEIARCIEKAYDRISSHEATRMLFLDSPQQTDVYASKRGWTATHNVYQFSTEVKHTEDVISTEDLASQAIGYARELEMIV
ncbi:hypothetical protein HPB51_020723 [Rhipicephalus microplus]|uniref:CSN8/PSMD8/EIF3K domain-containing protein n=1 Tax=Rhipicephalus microplus TaxID=6941 RepID=A0A9J6E384_RHIMP|nr:hypothetical protein HPB51_020723 [Rhipicephalus microplus]